MCYNVLGGCIMELNVELPDFLTRRDDGEIVVTGTRVTLYLFDFYRKRYQSVQSLREHYPHLSSATILATIRFCEKHPVELAKFATEYESELVRLRGTTGQTLDLDELRCRSALQQTSAA